MRLFCEQPGIDVIPYDVIDNTFTKLTEQLAKLHGPVDNYDRAVDEIEKLVEDVSNEIADHVCNDGTCHWVGDSDDLDIERLARSVRWTCPLCGTVHTEREDD